MDKYEYKISVDEIKRLIKEGDYQSAVEIADTIDWRRVKSVMMLCTISDLYKINRRYEDARDVLLLAYERRPGGRTICYSLCELCLKTGQLVPAMEYFKEFVQIAPNDPGRYILQYKIYQSQGVSVEEKIQLLEELKKKDYREKWAYELACLYHQNGDISKCVEECDELILWFGEGKYVIKAMELKMQHQPLSEEQQYRYDHRFDKNDASVSENQGKEISPEDVLVKTVDVSKFNTMNLQEELAAGVKEVMDKEAQNAAVSQDEESQTQAEQGQETRIFDIADQEAINQEIVNQEVVNQEVVNREVVNQEVGSQNAENENEDSQDVEAQRATSREAESWEGNTTDYQQPSTYMTDASEIQEAQFSETQNQEAQNQETQNQETQNQETLSDTSTKIWGSEEVAQKLEEIETFKASAHENMVVDALQKDVLLSQPPQAMANVLAQESDGQISLVMPEREAVEKQITGQISIDEVLADWEEKKRQSQKKHEEEIRQRVLQDTGEMFSEFEQAVRDGLLEKLEKEIEFEPLPTEEVISEEAVEEESAVEEPTVDEPFEEEPTVDEPFEEEPAVDEPFDEEPVVEEPVAEEPDVEEAPIDIDEIAAEDMSTEAAPAETIPAEEPEPSLTMDEELEKEINQHLSDDSKEKSQEKPKETKKEAKKEIQTDASEQTDKDTAEDSQIRELTKDERELFAPFIQTKAAKEQLINVLDKINIAPYTGNVIITGVAGLDTLALAKALIEEEQAVDGNFTGQSAKISGEKLNRQNVVETLEKYRNGALIIEKASGLSDVTINKLYQNLQKEESGIIVFLIDTKKKMNLFLEDHEQLATLFNARMDLEAMSDEALANFGQKYALEREYSIDNNLGMLELHTRIEELQSGDHSATILEVRDIIDEAIAHANRKTIGHFFDILFGRRYDEEDRIILTEKDFVRK